MVAVPAPAGGVPRIRLTASWLVFLSSGAGQSPHRALSRSPIQATLVHPRVARRRRAKKPRRLASRVFVHQAGAHHQKKARRPPGRPSARRARQRAGMMVGDERYMPARDRGANRRFVRNFVDARFTIAEYFIFIAIAVLLLGFVQNPAIQSFVSLAFFAVTALIVIDTAILLIQMNIRAKKEFPTSRIVAG